MSNNCIKVIDMAFLFKIFKKENRKIYGVSHTTVVTEKKIF